LGNTLLLSGHHTFSPLPSLDFFSLDPVRSVSPLDLLPLQLAIQDGTALAMTDSSYMPTRYPSMASAAWMLAEPLANQSYLFYGVTPVPGPPSCVNAYHANYTVCILYLWLWNNSVPFTILNWVAF